MNQRPGRPTCSLSEGAPRLLNRCAVNPWEEAAQSQEDVHRNNQDEDEAFGPSFGDASEGDSKRCLAPTRGDNGKRGSAVGEEHPLRDIGLIKVPNMFPISQFYHGDNQSTLGEKDDLLV